MDPFRILYYFNENKKTKKLPFRIPFKLNWWCRGIHKSESTHVRIIHTTTKYVWRLLSGRNECEMLNEFERDTAKWTVMSDACPRCEKSLSIGLRKQFFFFVRVEINWIYDNFKMDIGRSNVLIQWNDDKWKHFIKVSVAGAIVLFAVKNKKKTKKAEEISDIGYRAVRLNAMSEHGISMEYWLKSICAAMNK